MEDTDIVNRIEQSLIEAERRWPGRQLYCVLGEVEMAELKAVAECIKDQFYQDLPIISTAYWSGVRVLALPLLIEIEYPLSWKGKLSWEGRE